jgi:lipopolysaccharide export system permease protein
VKITSRYVLKEHLGPLTFSLAALTSLLLLNYIARRFGDLVGKGIPWQAIAEFFVLSVPFTIAMTLPMAVLVSTLYAFSRLASENEITAFKASGVAMSALLRPVLVAAGLLAALMIGFNDQVLPRANHRLAVLQQDIARARPTFALREQVLNEVTGSFLLRANHVDGATNTMREVTIYDLTQPTPRTIWAERGALALTENRRDLQLTLHDGVIEQLGAGKPEQLQRIFYRTNFVRVRDVAKGFDQSRPGDQSFKSDREMSICELQSAYARARYEHLLAREELDRAVADSAGRAKPAQPADSIGRRRAAANGLGALYCKVTRELVARPLQAQPGGTVSAGARAPGMTTTAVHLARLRASDTRSTMNNYDVEIHKKFALAVACLVFVLLGAPIALRFPRGGVGLVLGVSLGVFGLYYAFLIAGQELAGRGFLPPWLAMWAANILFAAAGLWLAARMGRESGSARGGGIGELIEQWRWRRARRASAGRSPAAPGRALEAR